MSTRPLLSSKNLNLSSLEKGTGNSFMNSCKIRMTTSNSDGCKRFRSAWSGWLLMKQWPLQALKASGYHSGDVKQFLPYIAPYTTSFLLIRRFKSQQGNQKCSHQNTHEKFNGRKLCSFKSPGFFQLRLPSTFHMLAVPLLYQPHESWIMGLTSFLFPTAFLSATLYGLGNYRTSFYFLPSNTFTHCMAALLRMVNGIQGKELWSQTGRRPSPMEHTHTPSWYQGRGEQKNT